MNNEFNIVKIIDDSRVVVSGGCDYFQKDDILEIFVKGEEVLDPVTEESLGTLDAIKARLKVDIVYEKMCLCVNEESKNPYSPIVSSGLDAFKSIPKPLNVDLTQVSGGFKHVDMTIKIGDLVRKAL
ncbi:MAG: hypothetical protein ACRDDE_05900 [Paraclostridium sp.]|uniref:hypothetical protein n=1 Tax=Paraclostridium sp. TaxID=2023273 RepID=UPI003EE4C25E